MCFLLFPTNSFLSTHGQSIPYLISTTQLNQTTQKKQSDTQTAINKIFQEGEKEQNAFVILYWHVCIVMMMITRKSICVSIDDTHGLEGNLYSFIHSFGAQSILH